MATKNIVPRADSEGQIGTASKKWAKVIANEVVVGTTTITPGANVVGPAPATADHLTVFDSTTGKLIKDGGAVARIYW